MTDPFFIGMDKKILLTYMFGYKDMVVFNSTLNVTQE